MGDNTLDTSINSFFSTQWFYVPVDIFHVKVFLFIGSHMEMGLSVKSGLEPFNLPDYEEIVKYVRGHVEANLQNDDGSNNGDAFGDGGIAFIRLNKMEVGNLDDVLVLVHESLHVASAILDYVGIEEGKNKECLCYTHEYVLSRLMSQLWDEGKKGK